MARLLALPTTADGRGSLTVLQDAIPFAIVRVFYIRGADGQTRGGHKHYKTRQVLIALNGRCDIRVVNAEGDRTWALERADEGLLLEPGDWHTMHFHPGAILLVMASTAYDAADYIHGPPP